METYRFKKTGNLYNVINENVKSKQVANGEWVECVLYESVKDSAFYTREKNDFYEKFELVNED